MNMSYSSFLLDLTLFCSAVSSIAPTHLKSAGFYPRQWARTGLLEMLLNCFSCLGFVDGIWSDHEASLFVRSEQFQVVVQEVVRDVTYFEAPRCLA